MVFPLVRPAIRKEKELESDLENDQIDKYFTKIFSIFIFSYLPEMFTNEAGTRILKPIFM